MESFKTFEIDFVVVGVELEAVTLHNVKHFVTKA